MASESIDNSVPAYRIICPDLNINPSLSPPDLYDSSLSHFNSIPWTSKLLSPSSAFSLLPYGQQIKPIPFIPQSRNPPNATDDGFVGRILATNTTIPYMLCYFVPESPAHLTDPSLFIEKVTTLCAIGQDMGGWPNILHGGAIMTILDESMSQLPELNTVLNKKKSGFGKNAVTGGIEAKFLKPIPVDSVVRIDCWIGNMDGRKTKVHCEISDKNGTVLAKASTLWIALKANI